MISPDLLNYLYPIVQVEIYQHSLKLVRQNIMNLKPQQGKRGKVKSLSNASRSRLAFIAQNTSVEFLSMQTLTYGQNYPIDGKMVKKNLNRYLVTAKRIFGPHQYIWFLEFQRRGAPHYHIMTTWHAPVEGEKWRRETFAEIWAIIAEKGDWWYCNSVTGERRKTRNSVWRVHNHLTAWEAIKDHRGAAKYVTKYATKTRQKIVPDVYRDVGRFWGASRGVVNSIAKPRTIDVGSDSEARRLIALLGRTDVAKWDYLPKIIFTK